MSEGTQIDYSAVTGSIAQSLHGALLHAIRTGSLDRGELLRHLRLMIEQCQGRAHAHGACCSSVDDLCRLIEEMGCSEPKSRIAGE